MTTSIKFVARRNLTVRLPQNGKLVSFKAGDRITEAKWVALPSTTRTHFEAVAFTKNIQGPNIPDAEVLNLIYDCYKDGCEMNGNYSEVWDQIAQLLGYEAPFVHFRAAQLGRVGRSFEAATNVSFLKVCPDLRDYATNWDGIDA